MSRTPRDPSGVLEAEWEDKPRRGRTNPIGSQGPIYAGSASAVKMLPERVKAKDAVVGKRIGAGMEYGSEEFKTGRAARVSKASGLRRAKWLGRGLKGAGVVGAALVGVEILQAMLEAGPGEEDRRRLERAVNALESNEESLVADEITRQQVIGRAVGDAEAINRGATRGVANRQVLEDEALVPSIQRAAATLGRAAQVSPPSPLEIMAALEQMRS